MKSLKTFLKILGGTTIIGLPISVVVPILSLSNSNDELRDISNKIKLSPTELGKNTLPSQITNIFTINDYIDGILETIDGVNIKVKTIRNHNDDLGSLIIELIFSSKSKSSIVAYEVIGFKKNSDQYLDDLNNFVNKLNVDLKPTELGKQTLPEDITDINKIDDYVKGFPIGNNDINVTKKLIQDQNNIDGSLKVVLIYSKKTYTIEKNYLIKGFKSIIETDKKDVDEFVKNLNINLTPTRKGANTLPSKINNINTIREYINGIPNNQNEIIIEVKSIQNQNDDNGSLDIVLLFSKGLYTRNETYVVKGFKTKNIQNIEDVNDFVDNIVVSLSPTKLGQETLPSNIINTDEIDKYVQNFPQGINGISITTKIIQNQNDDNGSLEIVLTFSKGEVVVDKTFPVLGFKDLNKQNKDDLEEYLKNTTINLKPNDLGKITLPSKINDVNTIQNYVVGLPIPNNGISITTKIIQNQNDDLGSLTIILSFSKGQHVIDESYIVDGFKTNNIQNIEDVNDLLNQIKLMLKPTELGTKTLPSNINDLNLINQYIDGIPNNQNGITITHKSLINQNDDNGSLSIILVFQKNEYIVEQEYLVKGFKTTFMQNKEDVDGYIANLNINLTPTELGKKTLPSNVPINNIHDYISGIPSSSNNIKINVNQIYNQNNNNGSLKIDINFTKGSYKTIKSFDVKGFYTTTQQNQMIVDEYIANLNINLTPTELGKKTLPSKIHNIDSSDKIYQYIDNIPIGNNDVIVTIKNILNPNDINGSLDVVLEFHKGSYSRAETYSVVGFSDLITKDKQDVDEFISNLNVQLKTTQLGSETWLSNANINKQNIHDYVYGFPAEKNGVKVIVKDVNIISVNNGKISVTLIYSKGQYSVEKTYRVNDFSTTPFLIDDSGTIIKYLLNEAPNGHLDIPSTITKKGKKITVKAIANDVFWTKKIYTVNYPNTLERIGNNALRDNYITNSNLPSSVTHVGDGAFRWNKITDFSFTNSLQHIGAWAYANNTPKKYTQITIPHSVTHVGDGAFKENGVTQIGAILAWGAKKNTWYSNSDNWHEKRQNSPLMNPTSIVKWN